MKAIILLGGPGAGKGTLAEFLRDQRHFIHVSTGDMLRAAVKADNELGKKAKQFMEGGDLVPDTLVLEMIRERVSREDGGAQFLFDGFPRTIEQAEGLQALCEETESSIRCVLNLNVASDILITRLSSRRTCRTCGAIYHLVNKPPKKDGVCDLDGGELYQRADDSEATILNRLEVYENQTAPLIRFYQDQGILHDLDAGGKPDEVTQQAVTALNG
jgi:adenylate kinase